MFRVFHTAVSTYQSFMRDCEQLYVEALCDDFVHTYVHANSTIDTLNQGYIEYHASLHNRKEYMAFCKHICLSRNKRYYLNKSVYLQVFKNSFISLRKKYSSPSVVKQYTNTHAPLGQQLNAFMQQTIASYMEHIRSELDTESTGNQSWSILAEEERFMAFCERMNVQRNVNHQVNTRSNLFRVFFDDYFFKLLHS